MGVELAELWYNFNLLITLPTTTTSSSAILSSDNINLIKAPRSNINEPNVKIFFLSSKPRPFLHPR
jgi:hypothetical protein